MKSFTVVLFIAVVFMFSCAKDAKQTVAIDNPNFKVELLFEEDGCKVYRFMDAGRWIYWSKCPGSFEYETGGKHSIKMQTMSN